MHDTGVIQKLPTGIPGFDSVADGGLPQGRTTLVIGTAGSAKTVFATQFLAAGIRSGEGGVFVTFEESPRDLRRNMQGFGWDIEEWEKTGQWAFVDASPDPDDETIVSGDYDLGALLARVEHAIKKVGAKRLVVDSLGAIFTQLTDSAQVRRELFRISMALRRLDVTSVLTAERTQEYGELARFGVEEFVADNVIILRNTLQAEKRRRTIEILKFRGTAHAKGEYPFTVTSDEGVVVIPLSAIELRQHSSNVRITSGSDELDRMCGGGFFRDSVVLLSGATGTGKTLITTEFMAGGVARNERCLLFAFEESRGQLFRNARGWGIPFEKMEADGNLKVISAYPETASLEDHLISIKRVIENFKPARVAIDSLSALERVATVTGFREFLIALISFVKHQEIAGLFTLATPSLQGESLMIDSHISTMVDSIILLRYVEVLGEMRRGMSILKMRGSQHDKDIREFSIDASGMHIGKPFRAITGILSGTPRYRIPDGAHELPPPLPPDV